MQRAHIQSARAMRIIAAKSGCIAWHHAELQRALRFAVLALLNTWVGSARSLSDSARADQR
eukprot:11619212-Alexandrium_andersonii.AAC.1